MAEANFALGTWATVEGITTRRDLNGTRVVIISHPSADRVGVLVPSGGSAAMTGGGSGPFVVPRGTQISVRKTCLKLFTTYDISDRKAEGMQYVVYILPSVAEEAPRLAVLSYYNIWRSWREFSVNELHGAYEMPVRGDGVHPWRSPDCAFSSARPDAESYVQENWYQSQYLVFEGDCLPRRRSRRDRRVTHADNPWLHGLRGQGVVVKGFTNVATGDSLLVDFEEGDVPLLKTRLHCHQLAAWAPLTKEFTAYAMMMQRESPLTDDRGAEWLRTAVERGFCQQVVGYAVVPP